MNKTLAILLLIAVCYQFNDCLPSEEREDASEFLFEKKAVILEIYGRHHFCY